MDLQLSEHKRVQEIEYKKASKELYFFRLSDNLIIDATTCGSKTPTLDSVALLNRGWGANNKSAPGR